MYSVHGRVIVDNMYEFQQKEGETYSVKKQINFKKGERCSNTHIQKIEIEQTWKCFSLFGAKYTFKKLFTRRNH